tara:strand:- start:2599 stop:4758 length:2160 start_codon:yes stop_codon:yes gene_type:complete
MQLLELLSVIDEPQSASPGGIPRASSRRRALAYLILFVCTIATFTTPTLTVAQDKLIRTSAEIYESVFRPAFQSHCGKCHGIDGVEEGDVNLMELDGDQLGGDVEMLSSLIKVLDLGEMPPEGEPDLAPGERQRLVVELKKILKFEVQKTSTYEQAPIRRMNRFQYNNAVIDLLDLKCIVFTLPERMMREHKQYFKPASGKMPNVVTVGNRPLGKSQMIERRLAGVAAFPQDLRAEHGFDNRGDHLSMSPLLMESFLKLGQSITQSPDFVQRNVGVWQTFFEPPQDRGQWKASVRARLNPFLTRAFRAPVASDVLERYTKFADAQFDQGVEFTNVMKALTAAVVSSPRFFYLFDKASQKETSSVVDEFELASRMSFFLWGSIPDQTLLDLARKGELSSPEILAGQYERMIKDKKIKRFCDSFPSQWLQLERIISSIPNEDLFAQFYFSKYRDSMHMLLEPLLLFETVLIENLPITQLIDSDFTYRSNRLQNSYSEFGEDPLKGKKAGGAVGVLTFNRIPVTDRRTGGVITNAAVMTMTSGPDRTQPITRGAWVAGVIFNNPPEPPPADVPPLAEKPVGEESQLTLRERLGLHREQSNCKGCHEQIDPLGFALENYNPIGAWREEYANGREIDTAGVLFRKHRFNDVVEFKDAILEEKDRFARGFAEHLMSFALARETGAADQFALDQIVEATAKDDYKIQTLIKHVIMSEPFQNKTTPK